MKLIRRADRHLKQPRMYEYRNLTPDEVKGLQTGQRIACILRDGTVGEVRINGAVRRWKREPDRVEVPVKYGMYEHATFSLEEACSKLLSESSYIADPISAFTSKEQK